MAKYTLICDQDDFIDVYGKSKIVFEFHTNSIDKILSQFEKFVRASGFSHINEGDLCFVEHECRQDSENSQYLFDVTDAAADDSYGDYGDTYQEEFLFMKECLVCGRKKDRYVMSCIDSRCPRDMR